MNPLSASLPMVAVIGLGLSGCGGPSREAAFGPVQSSVSDRAGARVRWNTDSREDDEASRAIADLLARDLTADTAVQVALLNNRRTQALFEDIGVAQADLVRAGLLHNPVFDVDARFHGGGTNIELALVQDFLDIVALPMRKRLAATALAAAQVRVAAAVVDVAGQARRMFIRFQATSQILELRRTIMAATDASFELTKRLHDAGNITDLDFTTQQAFAEQARLDLAIAEAEERQNRERVNLALGLWGSQTGWRAAPRLPDLPDAEPASDAVERTAVEKSLHLEAAKQDVVRAAQRLGVARPFDVLEGANIGLSAEKDTDSSHWGIGPAASVPIPLFNQGQAAVLAAQSDLRRARDAFYAQAVEIRALARLLDERVAIARERVQRLRSVIVPLRTTIVDQAQQQYNGMLASPFRLIQTKREQVEAGAQLIEAIGDYWQARAALDQLLAGGRPPDPADGGGAAISATGAPGGGE